MGLNITPGSVRGFGKWSVPARAEKRQHQPPCHGQAGSAVPQGGRGHAPSSLPALSVSGEPHKRAFKRERGAGSGSKWNEQSEPRDSNRREAARKGDPSTLSSNPPGLRVLGRAAAQLALTARVEEKCIINYYILNHF